MNEIWRCARGSNDWKRLSSSYVAGTQLTYPFTVRMRSGEVVPIYEWNDLTTVWHVFWGGEYLVEPSSRVVVDLGANIGAFAIWAAMKCPSSSIISLEPFPDTFQKLSDCITLNKLDKRINTCREAIGARDEEVRMDADPSISSYCRKLTSTDKGGDVVSVKCRSLESLFKNENLDEIDFLKIDIEGTEIDVIQNASDETLRKCRRIGLEYHGPECRKVVWSGIQTAGFRCISAKHGKWSGTGHFERQ